MKTYVYEPVCAVLGTQEAPDLLYWVGHSLSAGATLLLIDLQHVEALDSSGIGTLMIARNRVRRAAARLAICSLSEDAALQIDRSGLTDKFEIFVNREEFESFFGGDDS